MKDLSQRLVRFILALSCYSAEGEWAERAGRAEAALLSGCVCGIIALDVKIHLEIRYPYFSRAIRCIHTANAFYINP